MRVYLAMAARSEKTKSALAIESLYASFFPIALRGDYDMCPLQQLGGAPPLKARLAWCNLVEIRWLAEEGVAT